MNQRYQKQGLPAGKTRRSAASAKPKRSVGTAPVKAKSSKPASAKQSYVMHPPTPEYTLWRRIWWVLLGVAIALTTASYFAMKSQVGQLGNILLGAGYASMFAALAVDWFKLRKMRKEYAEEQHNTKS